MRRTAQGLRLPPDLIDEDFEVTAGFDCFDALDAGDGLDGDHGHVPDFFLKVLHLKTSMN